MVLARAVMDPPGAGSGAGLGIFVGYGSSYMASFLNELAPYWYRPHYWCRLYFTYLNDLRFLLE